MEFLSIEFALFLIIVIIVVYHCKDSHRNFCLLIASLYFYYKCDARYIGFLLFLASLTYILGLWLSMKKSKLRYVISAFSILSFLIYFKYFNFVIEKMNQLPLLSQTTNVTDFQADIIMPLGISFITFQAISYLGDIYYDKILVEKNYVNVLLFICFFPNITSGPIQKAKHMLTELKRIPAYNERLMVHGAFRIAFGALQKFYISDNLAPIIANMLANINDYSGFHYLFFAVTFAIYIYSNFNSYSDIAIGIAEMLGIHLSENFRRPYLSKSIKEFWQRWHISLNSWFVDYLYIPLGGNRKGKIRYFINISLVFLLSGLWHGLGFHFVAWGLVNAIYQIVGNITAAFRTKVYSCLGIRKDFFVVVWIQRLIVFYLICISWIFFAVPSTMGAVKIIISMIFPQLHTLVDGVILGQFSSAFHMLFVLLIILIFVGIQCLREKICIAEYIRKKNRYIKYFIYIVIAIAILLGYFKGFTGYGNGGFIYGNF